MAFFLFVCLPFCFVPFSLGSMDLDGTVAIEI